MDKLSAKHPANSSKGSATPLLRNMQQRIQILSCETFVTWKKHQKSEPVIPLRKLVFNERTEVYVKDKLVKKPKAPTQTKPWLPLVQQQWPFCWPQKLLPHPKGSLPKRCPAAVNCIPFLTLPCAQQRAWSTREVTQRLQPPSPCAPVQLLQQTVSAL